MDLADNFKMLKFLKQFYNEKDLIEHLNIHSFTIKRWENLQKVPDQYTLDLKKLINKIGSEYKKIDTIKIKFSKIYNNQKMLDQFYTTDKLANECYKILLNKLSQLQINIDNYMFIEPSAGVGNIFKLLPKDRRIGIELIKDMDPEYKVIDFLDYFPEKENNYIVFGNPPFGLRGNMALRSINHASNFADIVAFILPPLFNSDGKGTPKKRIKGYKLFYSKELPLQLFEYPDGRKIKLNVCFQIWTKVNCHLIPERNIKKVDKYIKIFSLSNGITSDKQRNVKMINNCDFYLPSTTFKKVELLSNFEDIVYNRGYGILILKDKRRITRILKQTDWNKEAMKSVNSSKNIRKSIIENVLIKNGIFNEINIK